MDRLLWVVTGLSIGLALLVLRSLRRKHIRVEYSVSWLVAALILLLLSCMPSILHWVADLIGVSSPPLALFLLVLTVFVAVFYRISIVISDLKDTNIALTQKVAILEYRIQALNEKQEANPIR